MVARWRTCWTLVLDRGQAVQAAVATLGQVQGLVGALRELVNVQQGLAATHGGQTSAYGGQRSAHVGQRSAHYTALYVFTETSWKSSSRHLGNNILL